MASSPIRSGRLDGISGHGTFIAGLIAHIATDTRLEVVGLRNQEVEYGAPEPRDAERPVRDRGRDRPRDVDAQSHRCDPVRLRIPDTRRLPVAAIRGRARGATPAERAARWTCRRGGAGRK